MLKWYALYWTDAKRKRDAEAKALALAKIKRKEEIWAWINGVLIVISVVTGIIIIAGLIWLIVTKGNV